MFANEVDTAEVLQKHTLLLQELEDKSSSRFEKLEKIYAFITFHNTKLFQSKSVCAAGCSHCCRINVDMTEIEASYIAEKTNYQVKENIESLSSERIDTKDEYCPFLNQETHSCTIYEFRPAVCRMYNVFESAELCRTKEQQYQITLTTSPLIQDLYIKECIVNLSENRELQKSRAGLRDIRQWFN